MLEQIWLMSQPLPELSIMDVFELEQLRQWVLKAPGFQFHLELRDQL